MIIRIPHPLPFLILVFQVVLAIPVASLTTDNRSLSDEPSSHGDNRRHHLSPRQYDHEHEHGHDHGDRPASWASFQQPERDGRQTQQEDARSRNPRSKRRKLQSHESIVDHIKQEHQRGISRPRFSFLGERVFRHIERDTAVRDASEGDNQQDDADRRHLKGRHENEHSQGENNQDANEANSEIDEAEIQLYEFHLKQVQRSVVPGKTTYSIRGGERKFVKDLGIEVLVSDFDRIPDESGTSGGAETVSLASMENFAILIANKETGTVQGVSQSSGESLMKISQITLNDGTLDGESGLEELEEGGITQITAPVITTVSEADENNVRSFTCGVTPEFVASTADMVKEGEETTGIENSVGGMVPHSGQVSEDGESSPIPSVDGFSAVELIRNADQGRRELQENHHPNDHHHHDHDHDHVHYHGEHGFRLENEENFLQNLNSHIMELHDTSPDSRPRRKLYATDNFPDLYTFQVDIFIEIDEAFVDNHDSEESAIEYVNTLITAASTVYEREIDTHLHVVNIDINNNYDTYTTTISALRRMQVLHKADSWSEFDIHHGMLGRGLGGGIAYVGTVCNPSAGFGLSTGLTGSFEDLGADAMWDLIVVMHEIGHNFGTQHTHEIEYYNPRVDNCFSSCAGLPLKRSATLMSYCHFCTGSYANFAYTFGGQWYEGDRSDINNWINSPVLQGTVSTNPRRVPKVMYEHVSTRNPVCTAPDGDVPQVICQTNDDCWDGNPCTAHSCNLLTNRCVNPFVAECCGNDTCELNGEAGECEVDCGPWDLETTLCESCYGPKGMMFDVTADYDYIAIDGVDAIISAGSQVVRLFVASGRVQDLYSDENNWTQLASRTVAPTEWSWISFTFDPIQVVKGGTVAFYVATTAQILAGNDVTDPLASDGKIRIRSPGRALTGTTPFGESYSGFSFNGALRYISIPRPFEEIFPTFSPTIPPTEGPTTSPISVATSQPSPALSSTPSNMPSMGPTDSISSSHVPSSRPTSLPSHSPMTPSDVPSVEPTDSSSPSYTPSSPPTQSHSINPSASPIPTPAPTTAKSMNPSIAPSELHSESPSFTTTNPPPSTVPSMRPSILPTLNSSVSPSQSINPTLPGSHTPSASNSPSTSSSSSSSSAPSIDATTRHASFPSASPSSSLNPTVNGPPSDSSSNKPSTPSSSLPSSFPSSNPSAIMSTSPSRSPLQALTSPPSNSPSHTPSLEPTSGPRAERFYVDWNVLKCVRDCDGPPPCGGAWKYGELYESMEACCDDDLYFLPRSTCEFSDGNPTRKPTSPPTPKPSATPTMKPTVVSSTKPTVKPSTANPSHVPKYYVKWSELKCVQDCNGPLPCGGFASLWNTRYDTLEKCCEVNFSTNINQCLSIAGPVVSTPTLKPTANPNTPQILWYADYNTFDCVQDCDGENPCGGLSEPWKPKYLTRKDCCSVHKKFPSCKVLFG